MILDQGINQNDEYEPGSVIPICWSNLRIENENELNRKIREK